MKIEQIYTGCLAQGAYYIESRGEVAIIDPLREINPYLNKLTQNNHNLKYIFETHFHADFVSGHVSLAKATDAQIIYGPLAETSFEIINAQDGQEFILGDVIIKAIHTPGHTLESTCYLLIDAQGVQKALFSGDTLFIGDVGRPDLAQKGLKMTSKDLAGIMFDSLRNKLMTLNENVIIYPAHGAGSACGKKMSSETSDTLFNQLETNYALRANMTKDEFISEVLDGLAQPPKYFSDNVKLNKEGYEEVDTLLKHNRNNVLSVEEFENIANELHPVILDVRSKEEFTNGHIPNSIFIGLEGSFAPWVGEMLVDINTPILLVTSSKDMFEEAQIRLSRVGFDNVVGTLSGGVESWIKAGRGIETVKNISPTDFVQISGKNIIDVRKPSEYSIAKYADALNLPLSDLGMNLSRVSDDKSYVYCGSGYRSLIAISLLKSKGYHNVVNVEKGFAGISKVLIK
jgi:hydroxyacylglutathione hydrolase